MTTKGSTFIKIAAICLIALVVVSAGWSLATTFGLARGLEGGGRPAGAFSGRILNNGDGNFQPPEGFPQNQPNFQPPDGQQDRSQFIQGNGRTGVGLTGLFGALRWLGVGISAAALIVGVLAVIGLFRHKKWGVMLAIILAALLAVTSVIGFFRFTINLSTGIALLKIVLAAAVIVLLLLPASRQALQPAAVTVPGSEEDEDLSYRTIR